MDFQLLSNIVNVELDAATGWIKAKQATGEVFLLQPRDMLTLMTWSLGNTQMLMVSQQAIDQEALSTNSVQGQARPVRLVETLPTEPASPPQSPLRKRKRRRPLPLPIIQISQAFPCLLCTFTTLTMTAIVDLNAGHHEPWPLYTFCEEHLQAVLAKRDATGGLSLRMIVEHLRADA